MKRRQTDRMLLAISVFGFLFMSVSLLLISTPSLKILPGLMFWIGLAVGLIFLVILEVRRRAFFKDYGVNRRKMQKPWNGLLSFASNPVAKIVDIVFAVSFVAMIVILIITKGYGYICNIVVAVTVFSFCMHCVFNGRIYFHTNNQLKIRQVLEQKKANSTDKGERKQ